MGAAIALYSATCFALGKYENGNLYPSNLSAVVGLSGWLPCAKLGFLKPAPHSERSTLYLFCQYFGVYNYMFDLYFFPGPWVTN